MGIGIFHSATGKFDLVLSIRYDATGLNEIDQWEAAFEKASRLLYDATDGQHQLGNIFVYNNDTASSRDVADAWLMPVDAPSHASGSLPGASGIGSTSCHIVFSSNAKYRPFTIVHELGHYIYGLLDEYLLDHTGQPGGACIGPIFVNGHRTANACIMEARWLEGDRFGDAGTGGNFQTDRVCKFCHQKHPSQLSLGYHTTTNYQEEIYHLSCWDTMVAAHRQPDPPANTFGLVHPLAGSIFLPVTNINRDNAAQINWIVLGQQQRFILVVDRSGSMAGSKLDDTKRGLGFWVDAAFAASTNDRIGLITYSNTINNIFSLQSITAANITPLRTTINSIAAGGLAAIGDALRAALNHILGDITSNQDKGQNVIVLLTNGIHYPGNETPDLVLPDLINKGVQVYIIGLGSNMNANLLRDIARRTGGEYFPINFQASAAVRQAQIKDTLIKIEGIAHGGGLVADITGSTNPGIREEHAYIEQGSNKATFTLSWDNPDDLLNLELLSPDGILITLNSMPANVHALYSQSTYMGFQVEQPTPGYWKLIVNPEKVTEIAYFRLLAFSQNPHISGGLISPSQLCETRMALPIQFRCYYDFPLTDLIVRSSMLTPDGTSIPLEFLDDGNIELGDVMSGDGVYGAIFRDTNQPGDYTIKLSVESDGKSVSYGKVGLDPDESNGNRPEIPPFYREFTQTIGVGEIPHKSITAEPRSGNPGENHTVTIKGENTHFEPGSTTIGFGEGINVENVEIIDRHTALVSIYIDEKATIGPGTVIAVTEHYEEKIEIEGGFEVVRRKWVWSEKWIIRLLLLLIIIFLITIFLLMQRSR